MAKYYQPLGWRLTLKGGELKKKEGSIIIPEGPAERARWSEFIGIIDRIGPTCWQNPHRFDRNCPAYEVWAKPGDEVVIVKNAGTWLPDPNDPKNPDKKFHTLLVIDEDVLCRIEDDGEVSLPPPQAERPKRKQKRG